MYWDYESPLGARSLVDQNVTLNSPVTPDQTRDCFSHTFSETTVKRFADTQLPSFHGNALESDIRPHLSGLLLYCC
jgi:hypothetical protein